MKRIDEIDLFFLKNGIPKKEFVLDSGSTIVNTEKFVESHLKILRANPGNTRFIPYFERLNKFYISCLKNQVERVSS